MKLKCWKLSQLHVTNSMYWNLFLELYFWNDFNWINDLCSQFNGHLCRFDVRVGVIVFYVTYFSGHKCWSQIPVSNRFTEKEESLNIKYSAILEPRSNNNAGPSIRKKNTSTTIFFYFRCSYLTFWLSYSNHFAWLVEFLLWILIVHRKKYHTR